jgi:serine protease inhibitor
MGNKIFLILLIITYNRIFSINGAINMSATCSTRPLINKLGIKSGQKILILHAPGNYLSELGILPDNVTLNKKLDSIKLNAHFPKLKKSLNQNGMLWISWPKLKSKIKTDLHENIIRDIGLEAGLVDVKVCAINDIWSGLKFVYRLQDRNTSNK